MIKLNYITDINFVKMMFKHITKQNTRNYQVLVIISIVLMILSIVFHVTWLLVGSAFLLGVFPHQSASCQIQLSRRDNRL